MRSSSVLTERQVENANISLDTGTLAASKYVPKVLDYIADKRAELSDALQISRMDVIEGIQEGIMMAKLAADPGSMIKGWCEIGKMLGHYAPEVKRFELSEGAQGLSTKYAQMSDEELFNILERRGRMTTQ